MARGQVHFLWNNPRIVRKFESGISLHSHTSHSRESFASVPRYGKSSRLLSLALKIAEARYRGIAGQGLDFSRSYFVPPLSPAAAYSLEFSQIESLMLRPMVSITDHDTIAAPRHLQVFLDPATLPLSLEWTLPFGACHFHLGVHNLPPDFADDIVEALNQTQCSACRVVKKSCTGGHGIRCLFEPEGLLEHLSSLPDVLVVFNHPLWDTCGLGGTGHRSSVDAFLRRFARYIHALELNGLRTWAENRQVMALAEMWKIPIVSGGDRHGCEPNAALNLTSVGTFAEFVDEIRSGAESVVVLMPQYRVPLNLRKVRIAGDVLRSSDCSHSGRTRWADRICLPWIDGRVLPLSAAEWSSSLSHKSVESPQPAEGVASGALDGTEY